MISADVLGLTNHYSSITAEVIASSEGFSTNTSPSTATTTDIIASIIITTLYTAK